MNASEPHAIVIGAGFGGIGAALRLRARGYRVTLIDRQDKLGGRAYVYRRNGYTFDAGPTVVTAHFLFDELFALFDKRREDYIDLRPVTPWYRIRFHDGTQFDYGGSLEDTLEEIRRIEPADADGYLRLLEQTQQIFEIGFRQLSTKPFLSIKDMVRILPDFMRLQSYRTVWSLVKKYIRNDKLRRVFSFQPLLVGGNPFTTTSIYSLIQYLEREWGVHFAMGGTAGIVDGLRRLMEEEGITIRLGETVDQIMVDDGRACGVRIEGGELVRGDLVVSNVDPPFLYRHLVPPQHRRKWTDHRIERLKYSMGLFVLYFGATRTYPDLAHHTILLGERYKGLLTDIFKKQKLPEDFSLYLHAPTRTDPSMAPEGCESFYVLSPVPNLQSGTNWAEAGPRYAQAIIDYLDRTVCPDLKKHLVEDFFVTPQHFQDNLLSEHGSGFSIQPIFTQSAYFRFHNRSEDIEHLYLVGAGTHPGAGMPGVLCSAKVLDEVVPDPADLLIGGKRWHEQQPALGAEMP